jgi:hypothetical protein
MATSWPHVKRHDDSLRRDGREIDGAAIDWDPRSPTPLDTHP